MYLSIDTFSDNFGIAIFDENKVYGYREYLKPKPFSEILLPEVDNLFKLLNVNKKSLKGIMVNKGFGSNTGLRIGIITAKTLAYSLAIPVYSFQTLETMIYKYKYFCNNIIAAINIGKGRVAFKTKDQNGYSIDTLEEFKKFLEHKNDYLIITKNLDIINSIKLNTSLALEGGYYCLEMKNIEDIYSLEALYHD